MTRDRAQMRIVAHRQGLAVIDACCGAGKSTMLGYAAATAMQDGTVGPEGLLQLAFTNAAAVRSRAALREALGGSVAGLDWVVSGTFTKVALQLLNRWRRRTSGSGPGQHGSIITIAPDETLRSIMADVRQGVAPGCVWTVDALMAEYERRKALGQNPARPEVEGHGRVLDQGEQLRREIFGAYNQTMRDEGLYDFADVLRLALTYLDRDRFGDDFRDILARQARMVICDEAQDNSLLERRFLRAILAFEENQVGLIAGDQRQAIYSFRGADGRFVAQFREMSLLPPIVLRTNYRSTRALVEYATAFWREQSREKEPSMQPHEQAIDGVRPAYKGFRSQEEEVRWIVNGVTAALDAGVAPERIGVLARTRDPVGTIGTALLEAGVPVQRDRDPFWDSPVVADLRAWLLLLTAPEDALVVSQALDRPPLLLGRWREREAAKRAKWTVEIARALARDGNDLAHTFVNRYDRVRAHVATARSAPEALDQLVAGLDYLRATAEIHKPEAFDRVYPKFRRVLEAFESIEAFVEEYVCGLYGESAYDEGVAVCTVHRAKGREWDLVFLAGAVDGMFPSSQSGEAETAFARNEEVRLWYTATTRARRGLVITFPRLGKREGRGSPAWQEPSRFLRGPSGRLLNRAPDDAGSWVASVPLAG